LYFSGGASYVEFISKRGDSCEAFQDEQTLHADNNVHHQIPKTIGVDCNRLLFSIFSVLQKLGADERPEV